MFLSAKNKTLLFVTIVFALFITIFGSAVYINQKNKLQNIQNSFQKNIQSSYKKILFKHKEFYYNRIIANINSKGVVETFVKHDRDKLYELTQGRWKTLQKENPYLNILHFHLPDGTSFLRMHGPAHYGDRIADKRALIAEVHRTKKAVNGFEIGQAGLAFRIAVPIFNNRSYIGALEFGSNPKQILKDMEYYYGLKGALFIQNTAVLNHSSISRSSDFKLQSSTLPDQFLLKYLKTIHYDFNVMDIVEFDDHIYNIHSFNVYDFDGHISAKALFVQDITAIHEEFQKTITQLITLALGLFGLVTLVINFGFKKIIWALERSNIELKKSGVMKKTSC